jgi:hypothetical protein
MANGNFEDENIPLTHSLGSLSPEDTPAIGEWTRLRPDLSGLDAEAKQEALVGVTAALCATLSENIANDSSVQGTIKLLFNDVVIDRAAVFLPPDSSRGTRGLPIPTARSVIFLPPEEPGSSKKPKICDKCGQVLANQGD